MKNAIENVNCSLNELNEAKASLEQALSTVEKPENKKLIQDSLNSGCESIECVQNAVKNYKESSK